MGTGASKAKREGRKLAQKAYFKALSSAERIKAPSSIATNSARMLDDEFGNDLSYGSKRLAMQADKLAKKINNDDTFKGDVDKYNKRYDEIKRQMNGESIKKFAVSENKNMSALSLGDLSQKRPDPTSALDKFDTKEEAQQEASNRAKLEKKQPGLLSSIGGNSNNNSSFSNKGMLGQQSSANKVQEVTLPAINYNYRTLAQTTSAYNDLDALAKPLAKSPINKFAESYDAIAQQLKGRLNREINTTQKQNLNSPDILTGGVSQEVIR